MFFPTHFTVDGPALCGPEWYFALFATVRAHGFVHGAGGPVKVSITHFFTSFLLLYTGTLQREPGAYTSIYVAPN
jgi:hypothetical protein